MNHQPQSKLIGKVLSRAVKLWLLSQVDRVDHLDIKINGGDRQILKGYIPSVSLNSTGAVYRGINLAQIQLGCENIRINLGGLLKGQPLRLLEPIPVCGKLSLAETDLQTSLQSPLLSGGLTDLLCHILEAKGITDSRDIIQSHQVNWQELNLRADKFTLTGIIDDLKGKRSPLTLRSGLGLLNKQTLSFTPLAIEGLPILGDILFQEFHLDLGSDVTLDELSLFNGKLSCSGGLLVQT